MVVMVIYMAQINESTARMVAGLSGNPIPLLIPIVLTGILLWRNRISFKCKSLRVLLGVFFIWSLSVIVKYRRSFASADFSYLFFVFYAIIIAYIHIRVYKKNLFYIYEHILVWASAISIPFWLLNAAFIGKIEPSFLQDTSLGYNIFYVYNWISSHFENLQECYLITLRNPGFSWEPGRFAILINLAMYVNLSRKGVTFKGNSNMLILLFALLTTQSTTGYLVAIVLFIIFSFKFKFKNILIFSIISIISLLLLTRLDFMKDKILNQLDVQSTLVQMAAEMQYNNETLPEGEYLGSLNRFQSIFFESMNLVNDPILGYTRNVKHSFFYENISSHYFLPSGLIKVLSQFGLLVGIYIYSLLLYSSKKVSVCFKNGRKYALFILFAVSSISYEVWCIPILSSFWLFGLFYPKQRVKA